MRDVKIIFCVAMIFFATTLSGCGGTKSVDESSKTENSSELAAVPVAEEKDSSPKTIELNKIMDDVTKKEKNDLEANPHWIKDSTGGVYVWNPEPQDGESIRWDGGSILVDKNLFAHGSGTLTWYKDGQVIQVDVGSFDRGKHHGKFKHTFKSGNVDYSNWDHGEEIPLETSSTGGASQSGKQSGALNANDLSLGSLAIDDRFEKVKSVLGTTNNVTTDSDGGKRFKYRDMEVVVKNGKISALVSLTPAYATARGIREGSSLQEVFVNYGSNCHKSSYADQTLYEYTITSADGHPCYLRFAVNNYTDRVDYISERFVQ